MLPDSSDLLSSLNASVKNIPERLGLGSRYKAAQLECSRFVKWIQRETEKGIS